MAVRFLTLIALVATLAGCAQQGGSTAHITPPSFAAAIITTNTAAPEQPTLPRVVTPKIAPPATASVPAGWVPNAPPRQWRYIVIHHSATPIGGAARIDQWHRDKGWDELGYHFVIGNGTDTADGQVEVGSRWPKQKWGAHAKTPDNRYNDFGIGICLVGNFDLRRPSAAQLKSCGKLVAFLMKTYNIPASNVIGHRDTKATECPGKYTNIAEVRRMATQMLADSGETPTPDPVVATTGELLHDAGR